MQAILLEEPSPPPESLKSCGFIKRSARSSLIPATVLLQENFVRLQTVLIALVLLLATKSPAQQVFDSHVHLWEGEKSLRQYETEAKTAGIDLVGFGGMWFGGPRQALSGHPDEIRASNDAHFASARAGLPAQVSRCGTATLRIES